MGLATGIFWANRGFLALTATNDDNRNYFYGVENFVATLAAVVVPALIGWFISGTALYGWLGGSCQPRLSHHCDGGFWSDDSRPPAILERGTFRNPQHTRFVFFHFHPLWWRMLAAGPAEGSGAGIHRHRARHAHHAAGRPGGNAGRHAGHWRRFLRLPACMRPAASPRPGIASSSFPPGSLLFFLGAVTNTLLFNAVGVLIFIGCLLLAKPLLDLAYYPIQLQVVDAVSQIEGRNEYAYIFNHEFGLFTGALPGMRLIPGDRVRGSGIAALKYALPVIALLQLLSIRVAGQISRGLDAAGTAPPPPQASPRHTLEA